MLDFDNDAIIPSANGSSMIGHPLTGIWATSPINLSDCLFVSRFNAHFPYYSPLIAVTRNHKVYYWLKGREDPVDITRSMSEQVGIKVSDIKGVGALSDSVVIHTSNTAVIIDLSVTGAVVMFSKHEIPTGISSVNYGNDFALIRTVGNRLFWLVDWFKFKIIKGKSVLIEDSFARVAEIKQICCGYVHAYLLMHNGSVYRREYGKYRVDDAFKSVITQPIAEIVVNHKHVVYISKEGQCYHHISTWFGSSSPVKIQALNGMTIKRVFLAPEGHTIVAVRDDNTVHMLHSPRGQYLFSHGDWEEYATIKHLQIFDDKTVSDVVHLNGFMTSIECVSGSESPTGLTIRKRDIPSLFGCMCSDGCIYWVRCDGKDDIFSHPSLRI